MNGIEEIEAAITSLPAQEYLRFVEWFRAREAARWEEQMDLDCSSGRLDALFAEGESENEQGLVRDWPVLGFVPSPTEGNSRVGD